MTGNLTIHEIGQQIHTAATDFLHYCSSLTEEQFFFQPADKWSPAQQVRHLIIAADNTRLAFALPKFIVRWYAGKPNRPSRSYDELVAKYKLKLEQGGKASGRFIPKPIPASYGKQKMLDQFKNSMDKLVHAIQSKWKETQLDQYIAPHPLLGKITLRELGYFTVHHTYHHLESIEKMTSPS
ncbi:MAG TPA: DinB family protein [Chitinophagaceae bacterium]|nr:DinB family protein [Chitinophagaceae bacterium]